METIVAKRVKNLNEIVLYNTVMDGNIAPIVLVFEDYEYYYQYSEEYNYARKCKKNEGVSQFGSWFQARVYEEEEA